ncbi:hypothetical protein KEM55_006346, partial [Ascosphaera atra]
MSAEQTDMTQILEAINGLNSQTQAQRQEFHNDLHTALTRQSDNLCAGVQQVVEEQHRSIDNEIATLRAKLQSLCRRPAATTQAPVAPAPTTTLQASKKVVKIPDPAVFAGDRNDLTLWMAQVKVNLAVNASFFPDKALRIVYLFSCLSGTAAQQLLPFFTFADGVSSLSSAQEFYQVLENAFGDSDRKTTAQSKFESLYNTTRRLLCTTPSSN